VADKKKILFIINPKSGIQSKKNIPSVVDKRIDRNRYDLSVEFTAYAGHASEIAASAVINGYDVVVAVGGDGTINEVATALVHTDTALGVVPCGSGNGFARHIGIPMDVTKAIDFINRAEPVTIDYGKLNGQPFFCACGVGFDALVSSDFAKSGSRGLATYIQKTLVDWVKYKPEVYEVVLDSVKKSYKAFLIACGNASQYGNNAFIAPKASMHDGLIDVTVIHPFTPLDTAIMSFLLFTRHLDQDINITTYRVPELVIRRSKPGVMHIDGDPIMMQANLHIKCHKGGIKMLLPITDTIEKSFLSSLEDYFWNFVNTVRDELKI
jgi:YegS/Rv2252/BmrU family lipid kinase